MVENFTDFYDTFFEFSANIAYRIVKEKNISKDIAQEVFMYFLKEEDKLDYSDEECLRAKVHNKTRKVCLDYLKRSCNRHEMCIIDDEDNGEEIIDEKGNPEAVVLELEDKADRNRALEMLRRENPVSYEILLRTQVYGEPPDVVAKEYGSVPPLPGGSWNGLGWKRWTFWKRSRSGFRRSGALPRKRLWRLESCSVSTWACGG